MAPLLPLNQSQNQELLRTLPLSSSHCSPRLADKPANTKLNRLQSTKVDPRGEDHITKKGSDYPLSLSSSHFVQGPTPLSPQDCPACPVGSRLSWFWKNLEELEVGPSVLNVVKTGYSIKFWQPPPLSTIPTVLSGSMNPRKNTLLETEFHKLLKKGAMEVPEDKSCPGFYSRLFSGTQVQQHM